MSAGERRPDGRGMQAGDRETRTASALEGAAVSADGRRSYSLRERRQNVSESQARLAATDKANPNGPACWQREGHHVEGMWSKVEGRIECLRMGTASGSVMANRPRKPASSKEEHASSGQEGMTRNFNLTISPGLRDDARLRAALGGPPTRLTAPVVEEGREGVQDADSPRGAPMTVLTAGAQLKSGPELSARQGATAKVSAVLGGPDSRLAAPGTCHKS